jgi:glyoxylase-like metal-dependent hydrolase (beta-lactamase superfamily II)
VARICAVPLADGVWRIPTSVGDLVNTYALRDPDGSVTLVDAGVQWLGSRRILAGLAELGARPADVTRIVLTHAHIDHTGGLPRLVRETGAQVCSHERDAIYLREGRAPRSDRSSRTARIAARCAPKKLPKMPIAEEFADGEVLPVAGGLRVVHTPGHTPGHVSLLHERSGVLITGDALFNVRGLRWPPSWTCTDPTRNRRAADVLGDLDYQVAAFTHGQEIRHRAQEAVRAFLRGRER